MSQPQPFSSANGQQRPAIVTYVFGASDPFLPFSSFSHEAQSALLSPLSSTLDIPFSSDGDEENNPFLVKKKNKTKISSVDPSPVVSFPPAHPKNIRFLKEIFRHSDSSLVEPPDDVQYHHSSAVLSLFTPAEIIDRLAKQIVNDSRASSPCLPSHPSNDNIPQKPDNSLQLEDWIDVKQLL